MKFLFRRKSWQAKVLCLLLSFTFLSLTVSCSHSPGKSLGKQETRKGSLSEGKTETAKSNSGEDPWWKKPEYEWMVLILVIIGVGIAAGGAIAISSGGGGLFIRVTD